ncbi:hypothetical protein AB0B50_16305 [Streptomyces sp. NPDC041068]|uniref:hypothetical protein n=1 Tax=Streptomyces sp. NPDC041068 TaxID=3155130 RepID=UPI003403749C
MTLNLENTKPAAEQPAPRAARAPRPARPLDWAAPHGPVSGPLSACTGAYATALVGAASGMPPLIPLAVGVAGVVGDGIGRTVARRLTLRTGWTRAVSWLSAGSWCSWALATGPLSWLAAGSLAAVSVAIGTLARSAAIHEEAAEDLRRHRHMDRERARIAAEWESRIERVAGITVEVTAVEFWGSGHGLSLEADLPAGAVTWRKIAAVSRELAADAKLPLGCLVQVEEGARQGKVVLDVMRRNVLAEDTPYPEDFGPLSVLTGIPWGLLADARTADVFLREACAIVLGPPGSGKSTFLDVVLAGFSRCTDVVTWVIDLKAGAVGRPWVRSWLEAQGRMKPMHGCERPPTDTRPGVDWLAGDPDEALRMLRAALRINAARQAAYQDQMTRQDTTLLPIGPELPQIMIVLDEGAELLTGTRKDHPVMGELQRAVKKFMRTTRAMGERLVLTALDGNTSAIGDTEVRKFSPVGVALTAAEGSGNNTMKIFPNAKVDTTQLTARGAGVIGSATPEGFAPTGFKGWRTAPSLAAKVTLATNARRPHLDAVSARAAGPDYAERWSEERAGWLWRTPDADPDPSGSGDPDGGSGDPDPAPVRTDPAPSGLNLRYARTEADDDDPAADWVTDALREILGPDTGVETRPPAPADWVADAVEAVRQAGPAGLRTSDLEARTGKSRATVRAALKAYVERGELAYVSNGPHSVYIHKSHA